MDIVTSNYMPGDPRLIDQIVYELKSQGIFDQFRKECIADVDTKPAYQNLSQRVEGSVMNFLKKQKFSEEINKNQLREQLRKNISESGFLETGVERIVDQVVNPKINTVFLPKVEAVVYQYLGIEKPNEDSKKELNVNVDLLPNDLEAISPESVNEKKDESMETNENSLNSSNTKTEDESPPFELLEENTKFSVHEEISEDSHLSGISGLASHDSSHNTEMKNVNSVDMVQDNSQNSLNSEGNLSIVTSDEDTKMEICEDSNLSENCESKIIINCVSNDNKEDGEIKRDEKNSNVEETHVEDKILEKSDEKTKEIKSFNEIKSNDKKEVDDKKSEDKKYSDSKKGHDKHKSSRSEKNRKDDKDEKDKKSRSKSESKSKDKDYKSSSKHSSSSKDRDKDRKENRNGKDKEDIAEKDKLLKKEDRDRDRSKETSSKTKEKSEKEKDKSSKDKEKSEKERSHKDKSDKDKEKSDKDKTRTEKEKGKSDRDKNKLDKDKSEKDKSSSGKHSNEKSSSSAKKDKDKDKSVDKTSRDKSSSSKDKVSSGSKNKESSNKDKDSSKSSRDKDKDRSKSSSSSKDKDKDKKGGGDSKSRSSDKSKKVDKSSHNEKSSSSKKDKDKKTIDDHYSLKDKKCERRSTDRDSNDGSSKMSRNGSFTESYSQSLKGSSKESSEVFTSGSGDSSNSDKIEENQIESTKDLTIVDVVEAPQTIKYIKPKFASNIHEAMKIMKIRRQLAKLERQNQLALAHVPSAKDSEDNAKIQPDLKELSIVLEKSPQQLQQNVINSEDVSPSKQHIAKEEPELPINNSSAENEPNKQDTLDTNLHQSCVTSVLKSQDLSMESFEALEARLAQEMSNVNYNTYGEEDDTYECTSISTSPVKKRKAEDEIKPCLKKILFNTSNVTIYDEEVELVASKQDGIQSDNASAEKNDFGTPIPISKETVVKEQETDITEQLKVPSKIAETVTKKIKRIIIYDMPVNKNVNIIENKIELSKKPVKCKEEPTVQDSVNNKCEKETELPVNHNVDSEDNNKESNEEFKGFKDIDRDNSKVNKFTQSITKMILSIDQMLNNPDKSITKKNNETTVISKTDKSKIISPGKENENRLKHGFKASVKEVKNMSSTLQDLLQKNGKKLFIKIDKLECELPPKALVNLQGMESREIVNSHVSEVNNVSLGLRNVIQERLKHIMKGKVKIIQVPTKEEFKQNGQLLKESLNVGDTRVMLKSDNMTEEEKKHGESNVFTWDDDDSPCYYLNKSNSNNEAHIKILNNIIEKLEKAIQNQSLQIHNNIPQVKKRGRKRKADSPEINIVSQCKPEPKKRHVDDAKSKTAGESLCNNNDSPNQSFSLPLSPADSDKSEEHKKEEPVTVKTKRTGRVSLGTSNNKRYSSEDLYKPRPNLNFTSARRRGVQPEENKL